MISIFLKLAPPVGFEPRDPFTRGAFYQLNYRRILAVYTGLEPVISYVTGRHQLHLDQ